MMTKEFKNKHRLLPDHLFSNNFDVIKITRGFYNKTTLFRTLLIFIVSRAIIQSYPYRKETSPDFCLLPKMDSKNSSTKTESSSISEIPKKKRPLLRIFCDGFVLVGFKKTRRKIPLCAEYRKYFKAPFPKPKPRKKCFLIFCIIFLRFGGNGIRPLKKTLSWVLCQYLQKNFNFILCMAYILL